MLTIIDLDAILNMKEIKKNREFFKLRKNSTIMFAGCNVTKNMIDNLKISYDYFYRKDKKFVLKKREIVADAHSLADAIEIAKDYQEISDEEVFVFGRNLELSEDNSYQVFDLEDKFTDIYEPTSEVNTFIKQIIYR